MEKDKLIEMQKDAIDVIAYFNEKLEEFTKKYPGFSVQISDSSDLNNGSKCYSGIIIGNI